MFSNFQHSALHSDSYSHSASATTETTTLTKKNTRTAFLENLVIVREIAYKRRRVAIPQVPLPTPFNPSQLLTTLNLTCHVDALATGQSSRLYTLPSIAHPPRSPRTRQSWLADHREALFDRL